MKVQTQSNSVLWVTLFFLLLPGMPLLAQVCVSGDCINGTGTYVWTGTNEKYIGEFKDGKMHGQGTFFWADGGKYEGGFFENKKHGVGTQYYANGSTKKGYWEYGSFQKEIGAVADNGTPSGGSTTAKPNYQEGNNTTARQTGCIAGNCKTGTGTYVWGDGSRYEGEFKYSKLEGEGTYTWPSGLKYIGQWKANKKHGIGTQYYPSGEVKSGRWENNYYLGPEGGNTVASNESTGCIKGDCNNGTGTYIWKTGDRYDGAFMNRQLHGYGTYTWADGSVYEGHFKANKKNGEGKYTQADGVTKTGTWSDGRFVEATTQPIIRDEALTDTEAPKIIITEPVVSRGVATVVRRGTVEVKGYVTDASGVEKVRVNGFNAHLTAPRAKQTEFTARLNLVEGKNDFWVDATDTKGNTKKLDYAFFFEPESTVSKGFEAEVISTGTGKRTALVIGNSDYDSAPLKNAKNDADSIAFELKRLNFEVIHLTNVDQRTMEMAIDEFGKKLREKGGAGMFYFAGHGVQLSGENYLIPLGADIKKEKEIKYKSVHLGYLLDELAIASNDLNIVVLDACRD
ncbi:MAG: caspase family protein, partial [Bacteroidota bacterium]